MISEASGSEMGTTACNFQGCLALANARAKFRSACDFPSPGAGCLQSLLFPCKTVIWFLPEIGWHGNRMRTECKVAGNGAAHNFRPDLQNGMQQDLDHFPITKIPAGRGESVRCDVQNWIAASIWRERNKKLAVEIALVPD
ncbi:hypothetical protein KI387_041404, partial [Taxus chinensis]